MLKMILEGPDLCSVCVHRYVKCSYLRDLLSVLFVYIVILKVVLERLALDSVCIHRNFECKFWRDIHLVHLVYIVMLKIGIGQTCVWYSWCTS